MENTQLLEIRISSQQEYVVSKVKNTLKEVNVQELPVHRADIVTIIAIAASAVKLINELIELYKKIKSKEIKAPVVVKNINGDSLDLANTTENEIENFVKRSVN